MNSNLRNKSPFSKYIYSSIESKPKPEVYIPIESETKLSAGQVFLTSVGQPVYVGRVGEESGIVDLQKLF